MSILEFMSDSPMLTFMLALLAGLTIDGCVKSICNRGNKSLDESQCEEDS